jgi:hypothetical protein
MKTHLYRSIAVALLALFFAQSALATCGGGGGGGGGGMANSGGSGGGSNAPVYIVPWKKDAAPQAGGLVLYWFLTGQKEFDNSSLRQSRLLLGYATQCVTMQLADPHIPNADKLIGDSKLPVAVLAKADGTPINKVDNTNGKLKVTDVEKLVDTEMKQRESSVDGQLKEAAGKLKAGDKDGAIGMYKSVLDQKCLFPKKAKEAAKQLKTLGVGDIAAVPARVR